VANFKISGLTARGTSAAIAADDVLLIADPSTNNHKVTFSDFNRITLAGTASAPSIGFFDSFTTGLYQSAANEIAFSVSGTHAGKFDGDGFEIGAPSGTARFQVHSTTTNDDVIFENTEASSSASPNVVLYRHKAANNTNVNGDSLGQFIFRGETVAGAVVDYARVLCRATDVTNKEGAIDFKTISAGLSDPTSRLVVKGANVGVNTSDPQLLFHVKTNAVTDPVRLECTTNSAATGAGLDLYRHRGAAGQNNDQLSKITFKGNNAANSTVNYASINATILDSNATSEDGQLTLSVAANNTEDSARVIINADRIQLLSTANIKQTAPASSSATGVTGDIGFNSTYFYICIGTNSWKRITLESF
jgi:hypothetical protein